MTPEAYTDLVNHIVRETGLPRAKADAVAAVMGDRPEIDDEGLLVIRSGKKIFRIKPWI
jgi:hypothetical protein